MISLSRWVRCICLGGAAVCLLALAGCGEKDCYVVVSETRGLTVEAPVVWQDAFVGHVSALEGKIVRLGIKGEFADKIRAGVSAQIVTDAKIYSTPFVLLIGGKDMAMPVLGMGAQIPEVRPMAPETGGFLDWVKNSSHTGEKAGGGLLIVLLIFLRFVKRLVKLLIKLLILCVIILVVLLSRQDWSAYQERAKAAISGAREAASWVSSNSETIRAVLEKAK